MITNFCENAKKTQIVDNYISQNLQIKIFKIPKLWEMDISNS